MAEKINELDVEVVEYDVAKAEKNLKENDWSGKMTNGKDE